ncbi:MAG: nucleoside deaminase [Ignavibacteria bacterium]|nr:nucleoside deaminase [Ignavibacteria bacterium]
MNFHEEMMQLALGEAGKAAKMGEVPVGAIVTVGQTIISRAHNSSEKDAFPLAHAELVAITRAFESTGKKRIANMSLYVTLEPCLMCAGAIILSRVENVFFGCRDTKAGACTSLYSTLNDTRLNHNCVVTEGILGAECTQILQDFFKELRLTNKRNVKLVS